MNELIAMWTARAEQENNHEVALAIMQCVGELKSQSGVILPMVIYLNCV